MHKPVVIIGGGLAGLYAAYNLKKRDIPFLLLEAKASLGGRIASHYLPTNNTIGHDLGPTWIFPHQPNIQQLVAVLNIPVFEQYTQGDVLYQASQTAPAQQIAGAGEMQLFRIQNGMDELINALYQQLEPKTVKLEHAVSEVKKLSDGWHISANYQGSRQHYTCDQLLLALPPRMISQHLTPHLWADNVLTQRLASVPTWMAGQAKFIATFEHAFWRDKNLSGQCFSRVGPLVEVHDASASGHSHPALFGFIGVPYLQRSKVTREQLTQACLEQLSYFYGEQAYTAKSCIIKDWAEDEFIANKDDQMGVSQHPEFNFSGLSEQLKQLQVYFVGSEFAKHEAGYLEGAINAVDSALANLMDA